MTDTEWDNMKREVPSSVKIIALIHLLLGIGSILFAIWIIVDMSGASQDMDFGKLLKLISIIVAILFVLMGSFLLVIAKGLWRARPWARILNAITTGLIFIITLASAINGSFSVYGLMILAIFMVMSGYLLMNRTVKNYFRKAQEK